MINKLKQFLSQGLSANDDSKSAYSAVHMAAAALMLELARADYRDDPSEQATIEAALRNHFKLAADDIESLLHLARQENSDANALYPFTRLINEKFSPDEKYQLVLTLWEIAYADAELSKYEDHLIRKIAELIYLPHSEFIRAKLAVQAKTG